MMLLQIQKLITLMQHRRNFWHGKVSFQFFVDVGFETSLAFDLLRVDVYGFKAFCKDFFTRYPGYFISPLCLSGSAIESIFSQYKYCVGSHFATARASNLIQQTAASHHSGIGYRDNTLATASLPLKKKSYGKKIKCSLYFSLYH